MVKHDAQKTVYLIDGSSFLYRAYYGLRPLQTPAGLSVQAVYGFCRMLKKLLDTVQPQYIALIWDSPGKTARAELYQEYKATRQAPPNDLFEQKEHIMHFADMIGLCQVARSGVEADDIMFSLMQDYTQLGYDCVLVTSDKDMLQVLGEHVTMLDTFKDRTLTRDDAERMLGFSIEKFTFYYALLGDASDNIPGVKGVGAKGAAELVKQFDSLHDLYARLDQVPKERTRKLLQEQKEQAFLSYELFKLRYCACNIPLDMLAFDVQQWSRARPLFQEWNFKSLLASFTDAHAAMVTKQNAFSQYDLHTVTTTQQLDALIDHMRTAGACALDTEGSGLQPLHHECVGISVCCQEKSAYYIPFGHKTGAPQLTRDQVLHALKPLLEDPLYPKYMHHAKFDKEVLWNAGITVNNVVFDTMIAASLLTQEGQRVGLKFLSERYLHEQMISYGEVTAGLAIKDFAYVPLALATTYAAVDALQTFRLQKILHQELMEDPLLQRVFTTIEMPLMEVLYAMEIEGIYVDVQELGALSRIMMQHMKIVEEKIVQFIPADQPLNLNSPRQIEKLLFHDLGLPPQKKSGKGTSFSTDQEVLQALKPLHPVPGWLLAYRELAKLKGTYIDALPTYINPRTGRIHTNFSQIGVATGRLSSSDPNLQNIPSAHSDYGGAIRRAFKPKQGHLFVSVDYSQIELRVLAYFSQDQALVDAFLSGQDIHAQTAARLFNVSLDQVSDGQRQIGKRINFSVLYGLTPYGLSRDLGISIAQAGEYITTYFQQYPGVVRWMDDVVQEAKDHGFVRTWQGRKRYIPGIYQTNKALYQEARRVAINTKAQGTAADIMKLAMIALNRAFADYQLEAQLVLQIHDELLITVVQRHQEHVERLTKDILENIVDWQVPLVVTLRSGATWREASK